MLSERLIIAVRLLEHIQSGEKLHLKPFMQLLCQRDLYWILDRLEMARIIECEKRDFWNVPVGYKILKPLQDIRLLELMELLGEGITIVPNDCCSYKVEGMTDLERSITADVRAKLVNVVVTHLI